MVRKDTFTNYEKNKNNKTVNNGTFLGIWSIINKHFWKAFVGPFFAFGYPIVFTIILGTIFNYEMVLGSTISIGPLAIACVSLPTAIFEFKKSTLLKRIGATNVKPLTFLIYIALYYFIIMIISGLWTMLVALIIFGRYWNAGRIEQTSAIDLNGAKIIIDFHISSLKSIFSRIEWVGYLYSFVILTFVSVAVGLFIVSFSKSILMIQAIGSSLLIITMFLSGQVLPLAQIANVKSMWYLAYITPFKSPIIQNTMAFQGRANLSTIYNINNISASVILNDLKTPIEMTNNFSSQSSTIYSIADISNYIRSVGNYANALKQLEQKHDLAGIAALTSLKDSIFTQPDVLSKTSNLGIQFNSYNIFKVNECYKTINALNTTPPIIFDYHSLKPALENSNLGKLMNNDNFINEFKFFNNSLIELNHGNLNKDSIITIGSVIENILNFILPFVWIIVLMASAQKSFSWNTR
ncbi:ABC transporter permease [Mycoplasma elephantis]|uniref:ABC transporter permease n=1 Tax=Mycoplasma elephantis TaxID=114882 RepID=UPI000B09F594|nr:ABC transporter permease [Mycoplasma elephantis]